MRTEFLCMSILRVASRPRVKLASCKSALNPTAVYSTDRSKLVVPVLVLLFCALFGFVGFLLDVWEGLRFLIGTPWTFRLHFFILRDLFYVLPCVILFLCFQSF